MKVELWGVAETLLWTLYQRAVEARRPDAVLDDPLAIDLVDRIEYPFAERFGTPAGLPQLQALRAKRFDLEVRRFLAAHPEGTVIALGEGLETQFWRVDNGRARWVTVELPEVIALRKKLLPDSGRQWARAESATNLGWLEEIEPAAGTLVTAQGLLMYLEPERVHELLRATAERLDGGAFVFDAVPAGLAARSRAGKLRTPGYRPPPWLWGMDQAEERVLRELFPAAELTRLALPRGRGVAHGFLLPLAGATPGLRNALLSVFACERAGTEARRRRSAWGIGRALLVALGADLLLAALGAMLVELSLGPGSFRLFLSQLRLGPFLLGAVAMVVGIVPHRRSLGLAELTAAAGVAGGDDEHREHDQRHHDDDDYENRRHVSLLSSAPPRCPNGLKVPDPPKCKQKPVLADALTGP
jgi:O-methyltransferase involved in polyketide biosynthesis